MKVVGIVTDYVVRNAKGENMALFNTREEAEARLAKAVKRGAKNWYVAERNIEVSEPTEDWEWNGCKQNVNNVVWNNNPWK